MRLRDIGTLIVAVAIVAGIGFVLTANSADYTPTSAEQGVTASTGLTNTSTLTVSTPVHILTASGQALYKTNAITIAKPPAAEFLVVLAVSADSSNKVSFADQAALQVVSTRILGTNQTLTLLAVSTTLWVEVSTAAN